MKRGIFVGMSTVDVVYAVAAFPAANSKVVARHQDLLAGGPACNASITFSHLGGNATLVSAVGSHVLANVIREELGRHAVQLLDLHPAFDGVPTVSSIAVDRSGARNIISANGCHVDPPPAQVDGETFRDASVVLVDGHYMQACQVWARTAHARGTPVVLDGGSWKEGTEELLKSVDVVICSADFLPPGCCTGDDVLVYLQAAGVANIAITNGAEPIRFRSGVNSGTLPVSQVEVVDTMGAGDILHGAFCYFSSIGHGFVQALNEAAGVATLSCRYRGTRELLKHRA